jgi:small subunit ribosomal protein S3Ae
MDNLLKERIPNLTLDEFVKEVTMGKMSNDMMEEAKKIAVIRHVGVRKTKLLSSPLQNEDTSTSNDFTSETSEEISSSDSPDNPDTEEVRDEINA